MRLSVRHITTYRFGVSMRGVVQSHRLMPSTYAGQRVLNWQVLMDRASFGAAFTDAAGDFVRTVSLLGPVERLTVNVAGEVETIDMAGILRGHRESMPPAAYLRSTRATRPDLALNELAAEVIDGGTRSPLEQAHALAGAVAEAIRYQPGMTHAATTAAEALAAGVGVCQDHAHALIAAAICAGLPARYVTGYLLTGGGLRPAAEVLQEQIQASGLQEQTQSAPQPDDAGPNRASAPEDSVAPIAEGEASHAWAELWVEGLGWVGFDAANGCCPDERYIRLGSGLDADTAAPIRGVAQGSGEEHLDVHVAVEQVQQ